MDNVAPRTTRTMDEQGPVESAIFEDDVREMRQGAAQVVQRPCWQDRADLTWRLLQIARCALRCAAQIDARIDPLFIATTKLGETIEAERVITTERRKARREYRPQGDIHS